ncbi:MAG TPA: hypothetical protein VFE06_10395 [Acidobacteriaceae bacterium]|jgi:hypothetical protein|nr:hypothetical protein [Acidobacteriaceae bacterium]
MMRILFILAAASVTIAPSMIAQNPTVCVFQQKQKHTQDTDATAVATALTSHKASGGPTFNFVPVSGFAAKEIDAEAQRRNCAWVLTLWREQSPPDTPNYAGTLGSTASPNTGGVTRSVVAGNPDVQQEAALDGDMLEYTLRKGDSHKAIAHGSNNEPPLYDPVVASIEKKLDKGK